MNTTQNPDQKEGYEKRMARSGESAMLAGLIHNDNTATDNRVDTSRESLTRGEVAKVASGEDVRLESQQGNRVNAAEIRHRLETQFEQFLKIQDASEAERLAAEITGKKIETAPANQVEGEADGLSQQERLDNAQEVIQQFIDELTRALVRVLTEQPESVEIVERDSINYKTTQQLGEPGALNFVVADKEVAKKVIATFKELHVDLTGYQNAHKQLEGGTIMGERDGFVLSNEKIGMRLMFLLQRDINPETATAEQVAESNKKIDGPNSTQHRETEPQQPDATNRAGEDDELPMQTGTTSNNIGNAVSITDLQKRRDEQAQQQPSPTRGLFDV